MVLHLILKEELKNSVFFYDRLLLSMPKYVPLARNIKEKRKRMIINHNSIKC